MKPVIVSVHQIGKVGSRSLIKTLETNFPNQTIFHTHKASVYGLLRSAVSYLSSPPARLRKMAANSNLRSTLEFSQMLERPLISHDWRIVNVTREPVGRDVSAFFQSFEHGYVHRFPAAAKELCLRTIGSEDPSILSDAERKTVAIAMRDFFAREFGEDRYEPWYRQEVEKVFGVDVFSEPFDRERGFTVYRRGAVTLLAVTLEKLESCLRDALVAGFEGCAMGEKLAAMPTVEMCHEHSAGDKTYSMLYEIFRKTKAIRPDVLEAKLTSRYAQHFYTDEFLDGVRAKWTP